jgi:hypothetical protein
MPDGSGFPKMNSLNRENIMTNAQIAIALMISQQSLL